ncbi:5-methylcytosine-specific restriction endonuclease system specificity protein McrC [Aliikangiella maris]|uniref:5-methylcytosine-specific restriction endonuclease system specificity protein McrC n=2 Tax=Aliikangiella maris TaxID=3162458 RepID=A0ABV2BXV3_9GAMM
MAAKIPIQNIYYLLCYAWNSLAEGEVTDVSGIDSNELADLFATVLINGVNHTLRRGLDRCYEPHEEELSSIRGRIDIAMTTRRMLAAQGRACCHFDEFTVNTMPNRIIKSTLRFLASVPTIDKKLKGKLLKLYRSLHEVDDVPLNKFLFQKIQLNSNNRFYRFLLNICEMVLSSWLIDEQSGKYKFKDFIRNDKAMARLYESFMLNFYKMELKGSKVKKEEIKWNATSETDPLLKHLPSMRTDISIRDKDRTLIIDAKYYSKTLQSYYDKESIHSGNLYQILAYLDNLKSEGGNDAKAEGMLVYPVIEKKLRETYSMNGRKIHICTLDLSQDWRDIRSELLELVKYSLG